MSGDKIASATHSLSGFTETLRNILNGFQGIDHFFADVSCFIQGTFLGNWCH